jgi:hypothetical protein
MARNKKILGMPLTPPKYIFIISGYAISFKSNGIREKIWNRGCM